MPRTHVELERDARVERILAAAEEAFSRDGYRGTTMAGIARAVGVASNALYWYFPSKDALFCAVAERLVMSRLASSEKRAGEGAADRLLWLLGELSEHRDWLATVHERRTESPEMAALHDRHHELMHAVMREALLRRGFDEREAELTATALVYLVHGMLLHEQIEESRRELVDFVLERLRV